MDFSMKNVHMQPKIVWVSLIWLTACNNGLACLTFYFAVVRGEEKVSASIRKIHDIGGGETQKAFVKYLWILDPRRFRKGIVQQQSQAPSRPKPTPPPAHHPTPFTLCWQLTRCPKGLFALAHVHLCVQKNILPILRFGEEF